MENSPPIIDELKDRFGAGAVTAQPTADAIPTAWVAPDKAREILHYLKTGVAHP